MYSLSIYGDALQHFATLAALRAYVETLEEIDSPTGRRPRLVWTLRQQRIWDRMRREAESGADTEGARRYQFIIAKATAAPGYGATGLWPTLAYQITGDVAWAAKAWDFLVSSRGFLAATTWHPNTTREYSMEYVLLYDWLYPALTGAQRIRFRAQLDLMFAGVVARKMRMGVDSDQTVGDYGGLLFYEIAAADHHPAAHEFFSNPQVGGTVVTGADRLTLRNALGDFIRISDGGEWCESGGYNTGTMKLLAMLAAGARSGGLAADFPDLLDWIERGALRASAMLTPGLEDPIQWGDDQSPRAPEQYKWLTHAMMFDHPVSRRLVDRMTEAWPSVEPWPRGFLAYDPYGPRAEPDAVFWAPGQGILSARTDDGAVFAAHFPQRPLLGYPDHTVSYFGDLQLWRRGAWALTHPIGYGGFPAQGEGTNGMMHQGYGAPIEFRGATTYARGGDWHYLAGTVGGSIVNQKYYYPPPPFFYEWTRSVFWFHAPDLDTLVVCDRSHAVDPRTLPKYDRYSATVRAKLDGALALKECVWHTPVEPTIGESRIEWPDASIEVLRPLPATFTIIDERIWTDRTIASERKWHVRVSPTNPAPFDVFLTVLHFGDVTGVTCEHAWDGSREGVRLRRPGLPETLVLFNAIEGPALPPALNSTTWDPATQTILSGVRFSPVGESLPVPDVGTRLLLCDMAPAPIEIQG